MKKNIYLIFILVSSYWNFQAQDILAPNLINFTISPQVVDVSDSGQVINIIFNATDDISGVSSISTTVFYPNGNSFNTSATLIDGNNLNGTWQYTAPIPHATQPGIGKIKISVSDIAGNSKLYNFEELLALGFDPDFEIKNNNPLDTIAPILVNFDISPQVIDISDSTQLVNIIFTASDNYSGVRSISTTVFYPNGNSFNTSASLINGNNLDGTWEYTAPIPHATQPGIGKIKISVSDIAGNSKLYNYEDLLALGFDPDFEIINNKIIDIIPPQLINLTLSPQIVDISDTSQVINILFNAEDNVSGVRSISTTVFYPNGNSFNTSAILIDGNQLNGTWQYTAPVPHATQPGIAKIKISVSDIAGNSKLYNYEDLLALGFDPDFEIIYSPFRIAGEIRFDSNLDGCDSFSFNTSFLKFSIANGTYKTFQYGAADGKYIITAYDGENIIKPILNNAEFFKINPDSLIVNFSSTLDTILIDFCITPIGTLRNLDLSIIPLTPPARPGFDANYKVVMTNKGNQVESGTLYYAYDESKMDFVSTDVIPSNQSDGLISWDFTDLLPFETRYYNVILNVNSPSETPPVNAGDELLITCNILDNVFLLKQEVVGSYDPNDKTCLEGKTIAPEKVGDYVHYLIRFENTGNFYAENVRIEDVIDETTFDISTLEITDASHEAWARINGNIVEFIFENIQLPFDDASNDGYICFKIKTKPTLVLGNELKNEANIYFDYNLPILTNKTNTVVAIPTSIDKFIGESDIEIFPNPVSDVIKFSGDDKIIKVEIFDMSGRLVQVSNVVNGAVNVEGLMSGTYQMKVYTLEGRRNAKMVKI